MRTIFWIITIIITSSSWAVFATNETRRYKGVAKSNNGDVLYIERHEIIFNGSRIQKSSTKYYSPDDRQIAYLDSDYSQSETLPTYIFKDLRNGYEEGVERNGDAYMLFYKDPGKARKIAPFADAGAFSCQGWHYYLTQRLEDFDRGEIKMKFALPGKLDVFAFELLPIKSTNQTLELRLQVSSWLIRMFAPSINLLYDKLAKKLIRYRGVSNILDDNGKTQDVEIHYEY